MYRLVETGRNSPRPKIQKVGVQLPRNLTAVVTTVAPKFNFGATAPPLFRTLGPRRCALPPPGGRYTTNAV